MTTTSKPEIGATAIANGIKTNYLEGGSGDQTVLLIHGSGPGVTSYANWRLVIPALAEKFRVIAPDMVGFGYSDRPENIEYSLQTWADQVVGLMDTLGIEKTRPTMWHTRETSSMSIAKLSQSSPAPSYSGGSTAPIQPSPAVFSTISRGNRSSRS